MPPKKILGGGDQFDHTLGERGVSQGVIKLITAPKSTFPKPEKVDFDQLEGHLGSKLTLYYNLVPLGTIHTCRHRTYRVTHLACIMLNTG